MPAIGMTRRIMPVDAAHPSNQESLGSHLCQVYHCPVRDILQRIPVTAKKAPTTEIQSAGGAATATTLPNSATQPSQMSKARLRNVNSSRCSMWIGYRKAAAHERRVWAGSSSRRRVRTAHLDTIYVLTGPVIKGCPAIGVRPRKGPLFSSP